MTGGVSGSGVCGVSVPASVTVTMYVTPASFLSCKQVFAWLVLCCEYRNVPRTFIVFTVVLLCVCVTVCLCLICACIDMVQLGIDCDVKSFVLIMNTIS